MVNVDLLRRYARKQLQFSVFVFTSIVHDLNLNSLLVLERIEARWKCPLCVTVDSVCIIIIGT